MKIEHDSPVAKTREFHALHSYLSMAVPMAEKLCVHYPEDRAMQRLCIHLYDALELMLRDSSDAEDLFSEMAGANHSSAA